LEKTSKIIESNHRQASVTDWSDKPLSAQSEQTLRENQSLSELLQLNFYPQLHGLLVQIFSI